MTRCLFIFSLFMSASTAFAQAQVALDSTVMVERSIVSQSGKTEVKLEEPKAVTPGDKLIFSISYANQADKAATDFVVTNPIPEGVAYSGDASLGADYSVDKGKVWGLLSDLKVKAADGSLKPALPSDVTHVRWRFAKPIAPGAQGKLSFRAVVR